MGGMVSPKLWLSPLTPLKYFLGDADSRFLGGNGREEDVLFLARELQQKADYEHYPFAPDLAGLAFGRHRRDCHRPAMLDPARPS